MTTHSILSAGYLLVASTALLPLSLRADALADLEKRVTTLERKVDALAAPASGAFTCSAVCVLWEDVFFSNSDKRSKTTVVARGANRHDGFNALGVKCRELNKGEYKYWFLSNPHSGSAALATDPNVCVRD